MSIDEMELAVRRMEREPPGRGARIKKTLQKEKPSLFEKLKEGLWGWYIFIGGGMGWGWIGKAIPVIQDSVGQPKDYEMML